MRTSQYLVSTLKETPADAEIISHQLMLRAGMIRREASGMYTWLPTGLRVLRKVESIVRDEMNKAGALEVLMPMVQPAELWQESGRWEQMDAELLRFKDRHQRDFVLGPTHEEVITDLVRKEISSYKQLPINLYQIQTKFRDERRPRFGVMRAREFLMKDAYSFHLSQESLEQTYQAMYQAYSNIFTRLGLDFRPVLADTGAIGGAVSHEFHVLAASGEDAIVFSDESDYAANIEKADAEIQQKYANKHIYEVAVSNKGGLVMPIIVEFTYADGTKDIDRIPAQIWRKNENKVTKVYLKDKEVKSIKLDPMRETADINESNNTWGTIAEPSKFQLYKMKQGTRGQSTGITPMQKAKEKKDKKAF